jgi:endoglucanase
LTKSSARRSGTASIISKNIIVTVHYYHPMAFTHQGAPWSSHGDHVGVTWEGAPEEQEAVVRHLDGVRVWAERHNRPILLGEFGAYDRADMASRVRYTNFVARHAESLGWSWSYWQFDSDFIVYDIDEDAWVRAHPPCIDSQQARPTAVGW